MHFCKEISKELNEANKNEYEYLLDNSIIWKFIKKLQKKSAHPILYFLFMLILCICMCMFPDKKGFSFSPPNKCFLYDCFTLNTRIDLLIALSDFEQTHTNTRSNTTNFFFWKFVSAIKINLIYSCFFLLLGVSELSMVYIVCIQLNTFYWHSLLAQWVWQSYKYSFFLLLSSLFTFSMKSFNINADSRLYFNAIVWMEFI